MCFCDGKHFKIINVITGHIKLYKHAASIARRFGCNRDQVLHCIIYGRPSLAHSVGERYRVETNIHPECEEVRHEIIRRYGVRLGKIPDGLRHMLPEHRQ